MNKYKRFVFLFLLGIPFFFLFISIFFFFISSLIKEPSNMDVGYKILMIFGLVFYILFIIFSIIANIINIMQQFSMLVEGLYSKKNTIHILVSIVLISIIGVISFFVIKSLFKSI